MATENLAGAHTESPSGIQRQHVHHSGLVVGPTAGGPARVIRLHDPYEGESVEFTMTKFGAPPIVPAFTAPDSNHVFLSGARAVSSPPPGGVNGHHWSLSGRYEYFIVAPVGLASAFPSAKLAGDGTLANPNEATIPDTSFQVTLLGTAT